MLPQINTILFPVDLSPQTSKGLRYAASVAQAYQARLIMLHIVEPLSRHAAQVVDMMRPPNLPTAEAVHAQGIQDIHDKLEVQVNQLYHTEIPSQHHGEFTVQIAEGPPAPMLLKAAAEQKADLIIMGTHGHSTLSEIVLGSVAHKVIHKSPIPVLLVPLEYLE